MCESGMGGEQVRIRYGGDMREAKGPRRMNGNIQLLGSVGTSRISQRHGIGVLPRVKVGNFAQTQNHTDVKFEETTFLNQTGHLWMDRDTNTPTKLSTSNCTCLKEMQDKNGIESEAVTSQ